MLKLHIESDSMEEKMIQSIKEQEISYHAHQMDNSEILAY